MATPNSEQLKAIEHTGGVLLKAGAGSGKTFVLKEHLIYLTRKWMREFQSEAMTDEEFPIYLKGKFRKIVMMTFTNKAAGELQIRLVNEFRALADDENNDEQTSYYWKCALSALDYLTVTTIHGFCFKLIRLGVFEGVSVDDSILSETEFNACIKNIFDGWIEKQIDEGNSDFLDLILKNQNSIKSSMLDIFSDPTLRNAWDQISPENWNKESQDTLVEQIFNVYGLEDLSQMRVSLNGFEEFTGKKWYDFLVVLESKRAQMNASLSGLSVCDHFFKSLDYKIPVKPRGKNVPIELIEYYEKVKSIKDFLKKNGEHFSLFDEHFDTYVFEWLTQFKQIFDHISTEYNTISGFTFADLEYVVFNGLKSEQAQEQVFEQFSYFIVDEFQDTSFIQFGILEKCIGYDFNKLFCVGDLKQAIYGFRGGELGVFHECEKKIPLNLSMKNNYRSDIDVIDFNNKLFDSLFRKGVSFKGIDVTPVEVVPQATPESKEDRGAVYGINADLSFMDSEVKLSNVEVDYLEAIAMVEKIKELSISNESIAILYKRLKPSQIMISLLIENNISFTAQIKIPFMHDPLIGMFFVLIENQIDKNEKADEYLLYNLNSYLYLLEQFEIKFTNKSLENFEQNIKYFGIYQAFLNLCFELGINNSNFKNNFENIKTLITMSENSINELYRLLKAQREVKYSLDFKYGRNAEKLRIMTAHASKGLQYDHILLGGMYTNENTPMFKSLIGKMPQSFKWSLGLSGKKKFKTPYYILEEQLIKLKEFGETKRLFYVSNTRAEKTLGWVNLNFGDVKRTKNQAGSWINGINIWHDENANDPLIKRIQEKSVDVDISIKYSHRFLEKLNVTAPLFHIDNLGIEVSKEQRHSVILPELAVTKLATVVNCPRRFYFQNICKISEDEIELLDSPQSVVNNTNETELSSSNIIRSSAERGSYIHEQIEKVIVEGFSLETIADIESSRKQIMWAVDKLKALEENFVLIPEKEIKFEVFNYMISGIPDLILQPNVNTSDEVICEIWDYKTGKFSEDKAKPYDFQLQCYAYAQYALKKVEKNKPIKIVLCYVDEQKLVEKVVNYSDVENFLFEKILKTNHADQLNLDHCTHCPYEVICQK